MAGKLTLYKVVLAILVGLTNVKKCFSQKQNLKTELVGSIIEKLIENTTSQSDYTDLQAQLLFYYDHKINLNKTNVEQLQQLLFVKPSEISAILNHQKKYGDFESIYEIQAIENLSEETISYLKHFVTVNETNSQLKLNQLKQIGKTELVFQYENEFEERVGYQKESQKALGRNYYLGSPNRYVFRAKQQIAEKIEIGFVAEKDPGEQFFAGAQSAGFDFNAGYINIKNVGIIKTLVLGDFQANFGQGLTFGSGMAARKSAYVLNVNRYFQSIRPYRSVNEFEFLRGAAITCNLKHAELTLFYSYKNIHTNFQNTDSSSSFFQEGFTAFSVSGLHRTSTEIENKSNANQKILGIHIKKQIKSLVLGITTIHTKYSLTLLPSDNLYQKYHFAGNELNNVGADYRLNLGNAYFAGEFSASQNGAIAQTHSLVVALDSKLDACILYRHFNVDYHATFNNPFAENSDAKNEQGLYFGISYKPKRSLVFNSYIDFYKSAWLRYRTDAPSFGYDLLNEIQFNPNKIVNMYVRYKYENKQQNQVNNDSDPNHILEQNIRQQLRLNVKYKVNLLLETESRIEQSFFNTNSQSLKTGTIIYQDLKVKEVLKKVTLNARLTFFDIDDYNARIYAYEDNVPYTFSVPLFQNSGTRLYINTKYEVSKHFTFYIRFSQTKYLNISTISSGLEQINGNSLTNLIAQLQMRF